LIALWSLKQCGFLQFLVPDGRTLYFIDFFTFYLFPVPFNFLLYDICKSKFQKGALFLSVSYLINMGAAVLLQCMGIVDIFLILPITHLIMFVNAAYTIGLIHYEAKQLGNKLARKFRYPMYLIICFSLSELLVYYIRKFQQTSIFLPLGTLLFILMLIWIQVSQYYEQCIQNQKLIYFQKLANIDMLTEAMNRNAYENMIRYLDEQELELHTTGVVLLDLDNLKEINDNFGHEKGDEALKLCYQCIRQAFPSEQNCFRTDFYYIAPQSPERFCVPQNAFYNVMETHREFVYAADILYGMIIKSRSTWLDVLMRSAKSRKQIISVAFSERMV
jgi:GGDEF domain-containing protein